LTFQQQEQALLQRNSACHTSCLLLDSPYRCEAGHTLKLFSSGEEYVPAMLEAIRNARSSVALELYRVDPGPLWQMFQGELKRAAGRRVRVRLLVDSFGSRRMSRDDWRAAVDSGIDLVRTPNVIGSLILRWSTRRDHRKLLVVDSTVAFTGGMSIDDTFFRPIGEPTWRESMVAVQGPVVSEMQRAFDHAWRGGGGRQLAVAESIPAKDVGKTRARLVLSDSTHETGEALFLSAIRGARRSVWITNPFVVPTEAISEQLKCAVERHVDVRLLVPGPHHRFPLVRDAMRSFYSEYLRAGIRIFEYAAAMLHAKTVVVDDAWSAIGSFNLDPRSFSFNDEIAIAACDVNLARAVAQAFISDCSNASEVSINTWRRRGVAVRFREAMATALRPFL
jgi:cardiolipin synthase A/B